MSTNSTDYVLPDDVPSLYSLDQAYDYKYHIAQVQIAFKVAGEHKKKDSAVCWTALDDYRNEYDYYNS